MRIPHKTCEELAQALVRARKAHPTWGAKKLKGVCVCGSGLYGNAATRMSEIVPSDGTYAYGGYPDIDALYKQRNANQMPSLQAPPRRPKRTALPVMPNPQDLERRKTQPVSLAKRKCRLPMPQQKPIA